MTLIDDANAILEQIREQGREEGIAQAEKQWFGNSAAVLSLAMLADATGAMAARLRPHNARVAQFFADQAKLYGAMATAPKVSATVPAAGATVPAPSTVTVSFAGTVDPACITPTNVFVMPDSGGQHLSATVEYDPSQNAAILNLDGEPSPGTTYRITALGAITNIAGFPMNTDYTSTFVVSGA